MKPMPGMPRPKLTALGVLTALAAAVSLAAAANARQAPAQAAAERDGQHDFDFIFGSWKVHLKRRAPDATGSWAEFDGHAAYRKLWDGRANINEFEADSPGGHIEGLTLRTYNSRTRQWMLYWASSRDGILGEPQVGQFHDGVGEFYGQDKIDGRSVFVRYQWSQITPSSVHFEQALSENGGRTWDVNWISDMVRERDGTADPVPSPAVPFADGQHDFDPLLGSWRYHLKRRLNPLTGSNTWIDLNGTGECYKIWSGRAQLDTIVVDGGGQHIEGLTLRLFNPKSHEWRLYWANSKDGIIFVPQIGQFRNGHGEFYAQDVLNDRSTLVRFDWTALGSTSPHFEQSFSADGGRSWEVNWITDQTHPTSSK